MQTDAKRKHVILISEDFPPVGGGVSQWANGVATAAANAGDDVTVLTRARTDHPPLPPETFPFPVVYVEGRRWKHIRSLYWHRALKAQLAAGAKPDIVLCSKWNASRGILGLAKRAGARVITVAHGLDVTRQTNILRKASLLLTLHCSDSVVAVSRFTGDFLTDVLHIPKTKVHVAPNGVDPERFFPRPVTQEFRERRLGGSGGKIILTLARVIERKGQDMVIRAMPQILEHVPEARYVIAGRGFDEELSRLRTLAEETGVSERVVFAGELPMEDLPLMYNACDVYIMASRVLEGAGDVEGFGITFLEANACGKPVVGGRSGGIPDAVEDGVSGYLVTPTDVDEIAAKLITLLSDDDLAKRMADTAIERVKRAFTWDSIAARILATV